MVNNLKEACITIIHRSRAMKDSTYPHHTGRKARHQKDWRLPRNLVYEFKNHPPQAVAAFPLPSLAIDDTDVVHRKGWKLKVSPKLKTLPPP
jgi:hypothetical protein